jgi:TRAP-type uncharacterized transport system substrate-binding protein
MRVGRQDRGHRSQRLGAGRSARDVLIVFGPALLLAVAGFVVAFQFVKPAPPRHIVMASGPEGGAYHAFAQRYRTILARNGIELEVRVTAGSAENLRLLLDPDGDVEVAFLQGGVGADREYEGIESLGGVFYEPIWVFWRGRVPDTELGLEGRRVAVGTPDSGTRYAIGSFLELNGIEPPELDMVEIGGHEAADALLAGSVDAACFVATPEAPYLQRLLARSDVHLMPIARAEAYKRRFHFLARVVLPRGVSDLENDLPPEDIQMVAMVANLGAREDLHPALGGLLIGAAEEVNGPGDIFAAPGQFPSTEGVVLPMDGDARRFLEKGPPLLQRYLPFWAAIAIDRMIVLLIPLVTILYPLFKVVPPTYQWRIRSKIYRKYRELVAIESRVRESPSAEILERALARLGTMEDQLGDLSVPAAYTDLVYDLRLHLRLVRDRLEAMEARPPAEG